MTESYFPISFIMNRIFKSYIYNDTVAWEPLAANHDMPVCAIGLTPYFQRKVIDFESKEDIEKTKFLDTRHKPVIKRLKKRAGLTASHSARQRLIEDTTKQRKQHIQESRRLAVFTGEASIFESTEGKIIIPVSFETAFNLVAFAQAGKIVRLTYAPDKVTPSISVENPKLLSCDGTKLFPQKRAATLG